MTHVRCIWDAGASLGEGPVWVAREGALYWVDIKGGRIHRLSPASGWRSSWASAVQPCSLAPAADGTFIGAFRNGFAKVSLGDGEMALHPIADPESDRPGNRFNDGKVDGKGRFWAGTMDDNEQDPSGVLYRLDPDLSWTKHDEGYVVSNGPAFSPDGRTLYHTDTFAGLIHAFDLAEDGSLANKRPFVRIPIDCGYPDGMTVDAEGCLWVAHWGGWGLSRFDPDGQLCGRIDLPVAQVTSCAFGGPDLTQLFITSAAIGLDEGARRAQPLAGGLFICEPGVGGLPTPLFGEAA
ncbi:MAG: SMP-30/gluconolactonase/LRE family protein [Alphaproteobacteria bacterium]|jgi:sugar lactone lactonase YvrE|nr:SMP-30/gluconolactonase/LRE family protein [Alphaproteobacteria bacterium]